MTRQSSSLKPLPLYPLHQSIALPCTSPRILDTFHFAGGKFPSVPEFCFCLTPHAIQMSETLYFFFLVQTYLNVQRTDSLQGIGTHKERRSQFDSASLVSCGTLNSFTANEGRLDASTAAKPSRKSYETKKKIQGYGRYRGEKPHP